MGKTVPLKTAVSITHWLILPSQDNNLGLCNKSLKMLCSIFRIYAKEIKENAAYTKSSIALLFT